MNIMLQQEKLAAWGDAYAMVARLVECSFGVPYGSSMSLIGEMTVL